MRPIVVLGGALIVIVAGRARAAEPSPAALVAQGLELRRQAMPEQALQLFRRAHALAPSPRTLGQMGLVEASLERWRDAEIHLAASLANEADAWVGKNRSFLERALDLTRGHIGELIITGPADTEVAIDGKHVGTLPALPPIRVAEGRAVVSASGRGFQDFSKTVNIAARAKVSLAIVLDPIERRTAVALAAPVPVAEVPPPAAASALAISDRPRPAWRTWTGAGLVAAGAGLTTWGLIWVALDGNDRCATGGPACTSVYDTKDAGWILAAGGVAAAAAGAVVLLTGERREGVTGASVALRAMPGALLLNGRF